MKLEQFNKIKEAYLDFEDEFKKQDKLPMRNTEKGFWGCSSMDNVYEFFQKIHLEKYKNFLDLGSGDGRIVLIANLFTKATGIEYDEALYMKSIEMKAKLNSNAELINGDFMKSDFSKYDLLFIFPDKSFYLNFEDKLKKELKGILAVYNDVSLPTFLERKQTVWVNQIPIIFYTNK